MAFQKKVIILSDITSQDGTGIVKVTENGDKTTAKINVFNRNKNLTLLLCINNEISSFNIEEKNEIVLGKVKLEGVIDCLVIDENGKALLYGSTGGDKYRCFNLLEEYRKQDKNSLVLDKEKTKSEKIIKKLSDSETEKLSSDSENNNKKFKQDVAEKRHQPEKPTQTSRRKIRLSKKKINQTENQEKQQVRQQDKEPKTSDSAVSDSNNDVKAQKTKIEKDDKNNNSDNIIRTTQPILNEGIQYIGDNFYMAVKPQLDEMFICYPADEELNNIVPNSKWVRVNIEDDYYVVGIISELDEPKYICYGIHGNFSIKPPREIASICEWLPIDLNQPEKEGYWLIYQSAKNGKTLTKTEN